MLIEMHVTLAGLSAVSPSPNDVHAAVQALHAVKEAVRLKPDDDDDVPTYLVIMSDQVQAGFRLLICGLSAFARALHSREVAKQSPGISAASCVAVRESGWPRSLQSPRSSSGLLARCRWRGGGAERQSEAH
jgi:hypothetical protein